MAYQQKHRARAIKAWETKEASTVKNVERTMMMNKAR
jgi:hypothetical protein